MTHTAKKDFFGTSANQNNWAAYVNGEMLRDKRGIGRRFKTEKAAIKAANLNAALAKAQS